MLPIASSSFAFVLSRFYTRYIIVSTLARLAHHRWTLPVLVEIERSRGSRVAALTGRLGVGRESLRRTLMSLQDEGLVARNPGYGHPLRPEYLLTGRGRALAAAADAVLEAARGREDVVLKKWSLPVLAELDGPRRFSELRTALPGAGPRALTLALKDLGAAGLVDRTVTDSFPPAVVYEATSAGQPLVGAARRLGREDDPGL
jgi:DNA-binding HxlR family transcriptional regulator